MKKNILLLALASFTMPLFTACEEDAEGTAEGGDSTPSVIIYQYTAEGGDPDADSYMRFASNSATEKAYILVESAADYNSHAGDSYADYIVSNGSLVPGLANAADVDTTITLQGENYVSIAAIKGDKKVVSTVSFTGANYQDVVSGTYYYFTESYYPEYYSSSAADVFGMETNEVTLQQDADDLNAYRIAGYDGYDYLHLVVLTDDEGNAVRGDDFTYCRIYDESLSLEYGSYGSIYVCDYATWANEDEYAVTEYYDVRLYDDYSIEATIRLHHSAGTITYGRDYFIPAE